MVFQNSIRIQMTRPQEKVSLGSDKVQTSMLSKKDKQEAIKL